ncbi:hypothetical protein [Peribacillus asahii]|uniref:hypothetical protein n=1 Tax=Peribacillus asahii TaxID=228899 RepID=UPI00207A8D87|nr:hypothetical protein [Peribacillus asahii]USK72609.1 hypothetical protein LIS76_23480 [Peribacillus asahii]
MTVVSSGQLTLIDVNDSKQLQLFVSTNQPKTQIYNPDNSSYTPNWTSSKPVLTPQLFVAGTAADIIASAKSIKWFVDGTELTASTTDYTLASSGVKTLTINNNVLSSSNSKLFVCEVVYTDPDTGFDVTAKADIEFIKVSSGQKGDTGASGADAIVAVLTNESHTVPTDSAGNNGNFAGAVSTIKIYEGATDVTALWSVTQTRSGVTVTEATTSKTATVTAMSADTGYVEFTASRSGYANIVKRFNLSKNKQGIKGDTGSTGATGQSATAYWLVPEVSAIQKSISGVYTPASFIVSAKYQVGQGSPTAYAGDLLSLNQQMELRLQLNILLVQMKRVVVTLQVQELWLLRCNCTLLVAHLTYWMNKSFLLLKMVQLVQRVLMQWSQSFGLQTEIQSEMLMAH